LPAGAYFLKLTSKNEQQNLVYKVIKSMWR
jgi:hypothetical protein